MGYAGPFRFINKLVAFSPVQYMQLEGNSGQHHQVRMAIAGSMKRIFVRNKLVVGGNGRLESFDGKLIGLAGEGWQFSALALVPFDGFFPTQLPRANT